MAHFETYKDHTPITRSGGSNAAGFPAVTTFENTFDASLRNMSAGDTADVLNIPAGSLVQNIFVQVVNGETGQTLTVQDSESTPNAYATGVDVSTTGTRLMGADTSNEFYAEGTTLRILVPSTKAYTTLKVRVIASVVCIG
jgi:hypothetical protein